MRCFRPFVNFSLKRKPIPEKCLINQTMRLKVDQKPTFSLAVIKSLMQMSRFDLHSFSLKFRIDFSVLKFNMLFQWVHLAVIAKHDRDCDHTSKVGIAIAVVQEKWFSIVIDPNTVEYDSFVAYKPSFKIVDCIILLLSHFYLYEILCIYIGYPSGDAERLVFSHKPPR